MVKKEWEARATCFLSVLKVIETTYATNHANFIEIAQLF